MKLWCEGHVQLASIKERRLLWKKEIAPALDILHHSLSKEEFISKKQSIFCHWQTTGVLRCTTWFDRAGVRHDIQTYLESQWMDKTWDFRSDAALPTTNNGCESKMRWLRQDAGRVTCGAIEIANFLLKEVGYFSRTAWSVGHERLINRDEWRKVLQFGPLLTAASQKTATTRQTRRWYHVFLPRRLVLQWRRSAPAFPSKKLKRL